MRAIALAEELAVKEAMKQRKLFEISLQRNRDNKIAELKEQKSQLAQEAPKVKVSPVEQRPEQNDPKP